MDLTATRGGRARAICYSPALNYVFIHIPKCAGTSLHRALQALHERRDLPRPTTPYHKHTKAAEVRRLLGKKWEAAFTFSFVRNPWDLMVSSYHWWLQYAEEFPALAGDVAQIRAMNGFPAFLRSRYGKEMINEHVGRDFTDWLAEDGTVIVDFIGRYENLAEDWKRVCAHLGEKPVPLTRENQVAREDYRSFYDQASHDLIARRFAQSIALFGYRF